MKKLLALTLSLIVFVLKLSASFENLSADPLVLAGSGSLATGQMSFYAPILRKGSKVFQASLNYHLPFELSEFQTSELLLGYQRESYSLAVGLNYFGDDNYSETSLLLSPGFKVVEDQERTFSFALLTHYNLLKTVLESKSSISLGSSISYESSEITFVGSILNFYSQKIYRTTLPLTIIGDLDYQIIKDFDLSIGFEKSDVTDLLWRSGLKYTFRDKLTFMLSSRNPDFMLSSGLRYSLSYFTVKIGFSWHQDLGISYATGLAFEL